MRHELLLSSDLVTPLGRLRLAGRIWNGRGVVSTSPLRVYGSFALVCVLRGAGTYKDAHGLRTSVEAGQCITVLPELGHWYGTRAGETWDEIYLTFDGPVFDLWRTSGLLGQTEPVRPHPEGFPNRLQALAQTASQFPNDRAKHIAQLLTLLNELPYTQYSRPNTPHPTSSFLSDAKAALETDIGAEISLSDLANRLNVGYETFRKRFERETGVSPAKYRAQKRMEAAKSLLRYSPQMTNRQVAQTLGFADEYHFSRRFTQSVGVSPRAFRRGELFPKERQKRLQNPESSVTVRLLNFANSDDRGHLYDLRLRILRPNRPPEAATFPGDEEATTFHVGAFDQAGKCVGVATLLVNNGLQLRGMAVDTDTQGQGVGRRVLKLAHQTAKERGYKEIWCNARVRAMPFYAKNGWVQEGDEFHVPDVGPHYIMRKKL